MPEFYKAKCRDRYVRIQEYLRRMEKFKNDPNQPILSVKKMKVVKREQKRENRAKQVALIENAIERELLERLKKGVYGDIYNLPQKTFDSVLEKHGEQEELNEEEDELEFVEGEEEEEEEESDVEYLDEFEPSDDENDKELVQDLEDLFHKTSYKSKSRVEIEFEGEEERGGKTTINNPSRS